MVCPRCQYEQGDATECGSCGVIFARSETARSETGQSRPARREPKQRRATPVRAAGWWVAPSFLLGLIGLSVPHIIISLSERPAATVAVDDARTTSIPSQLEGDPAANAALDQPKAEDQGAELAPEKIEPLVLSPPGPGSSPQPVSDNLVRDLERQVHAHPDNRQLKADLAAAYTALGERYVTEGQPDRAVLNLRLALQHDAMNPRSQLLLVAALLKDGQPANARAAIDAVGPVARKESVYHVLLSEVLYLEERIDDALHELEAAYALEPTPALADRIARLRRELTAGTDQTVESRHFKAVFAGRANVTIGRVVLQALEDVYSTLASEFQVSDLTVTAVLYGGEDYRRITAAPDWSGALFDGKIRVPIAGLTTIDTQLRQTLQHELVHAFVYARGGAQVPRWLHEGLAQRWSGRRLADFRLDPEERHALVSAGSGGDVRLFYARSLWLVDYLYDRFGRTKVLALIDEMGRGSTADAALRKYARVDMAALDAELAKWASTGP